MIGLAGSLWMNAVWNFVHPTIHFYPGLKQSEGLDLFPRQDWIRSTWIYNWLWRNHVLHHLLTGQNAGNFNVTMPFADWLFGTFHTSAEGYYLDVSNKKIYELEKDEKKSR